MSRIFGRLRQNGYVVRDIEAAMQHWVSLGVGPWYYIERVDIDYFRYRGAERALEVSIALANSGDLQLELIQQRNDVPSMYRAFLDAGGEGLQHVAYWTQDYPALYETALSAGFRVEQEGRSGGEHGRFAYFESRGHPGSVIEIADTSGGNSRFFEKIRNAAADWDGSDPIRAVG